MWTKNQAKSCVYGFCADFESFAFVYTLIGD